LTTLFEPIERDRVIDIFRKHAAEYPVTLVVAPAGFGKSVAVRHYLERDDISYVRVALRREHETLLGFLTGFATAIAQIAPDVMGTLYSAYEAATSARHCVAELASWLTRQLSAFHGTIVIDDVHLTCNDPRIAELISELIERTPSNKWILVTRDASALATASWIGYGHLGSPIVASDLAVNIGEAALIAEGSGATFTADDLKELLDLTQSWPVAFAFSIHGASHTSDLRVLASGTREMVYAFLADQVLRKLDREERDFLFATALFPTLDFDLLKLAGFSDPAASIERVRRSTAFVSTERSGIFRYHDLFRDFLDNQLRLAGKAKYSAACSRAASLLAKTGDFTGALEVYSLAALESEIISLLEVIGLRLVDSGQMELVETILDQLEHSAEKRTPQVVALLGYVKRCRGDYAAADRLFRSSIESAHDPEIRGDLAIRYAGLLCYPTQRYLEALQILENASTYCVNSTKLRPRFVARRAMLLSCLDRNDEAVALAEIALSEVCTLDQLDPIRHSVTAAAAQVALSCENFDMASTLAIELETAATVAGLFTVANVALTNIIRTTYEQGKLRQCHDALERFRQHAEKTGLRNERHYYLAVSYDLAMCRGDVDAIREIETKLEQEGKHGLGSIASLELVYSLRAARAGKFREAYERASHWRPDSSPSEVLLNSARRLVYSAAAGMRDEANACLATFNTELAKRSTLRKDSFVIGQARALGALGALLLDRPAACASLLGELERFGSTKYPEVVLLTRIVRKMQFYMETGTGADEIASDIEQLRDSALGGYADVLCRLSSGKNGARGTFAVLTDSELKVLRLISCGASSREIAAATSRSALTIDTHVKAIARKLRCKGRREAVAIARSRGIL
jgi:ATP/maltotriose-dependent transcriptional regulator MalT